MRVFTCQQCEYSSSGSDVSVNAVIIHRYILPRTTVFPHCNRSWQNASLCMSNMVSNFFGYLIGCCSLTIHVHKTLPIFSSSKTFCQNLPEINRSYISMYLYKYWLHWDCIRNFTRLWIIGLLNRGSLFRLVLPEQPVERNLLSSGSDEEI